MMYIKMSFVKSTGNYHGKKKSISFQNRHKAESKTPLNVFDSGIIRL